MYIFIQEMLTFKTFLKNPSPSSKKELKMLYLHERGNFINEIGRSCPERVLQLLSSMIKLGR